MNQPPTFPVSTPLEYSLFSPSKAAEQQRLAKDWNYVHQFLRQKYPSPQKVPRFEENEETLKALLALAAWNERGDEAWGQLCGIEEMGVRELEEMEERTHNTTNTLNNTLTTSLQSSLSANGITDLTAQATTAVTLNTTTTSATTLATTLLTLSTTLSSLNNQLSATQTLKANLLTHQSSLQTEHQTLTSQAFQTESNLPKRTAEVSRQTKVLKAKVAEYDERLRNASDGGAEIPEVLLAEVEASKTGLGMLMKRLSDVESRIEVFEGVPPEAKEVRRVMQDLRAELEGWVMKRDGMFEGLVGCARR
ncbi:unnamed protein product [Aureobasidium uvarum]|uniref:Uncharacterized protein n=1 Tax=Aureobasidium uvarum TaxID=2773716 RepID=A0A9N8KHH3_9PEZI|nr:unnamed protein product [Aureobasidium uvarum]